MFINFNFDTSRLWGINYSEKSARAKFHQKHEHTHTHICIEQAGSVLNWTGVTRPGHFYPASRKNVSIDIHRSTKRSIDRGARQAACVAAQSSGGQHAYYTLTRLFSIRVDHCERDSVCLVVAALTLMTFRRGGMGHQRLSTGKSVPPPRDLARFCTATANN